MTLTTISGTPASRFVFGCMQWGGNASPEDAAATWEAARASGITHFDTALVYTEGRSEEILGNLLKGVDRDAQFVATKAAYTGGASKDNLTRSLETSRKRLGLDTIDLYYMHRWDPDTPLEETFETLAAMQSRGEIRYIGVSNYAAWQVMKAQAVAASFGTRINAIQPMLNLVKRQAEVEILPMAADQGITVCSYSPLGGGLLTGKYVSGSGEGRLANDPRYRARYGLPWMDAAAEGLSKIAQREGINATTLAIAWLARHAPAVCPILSARNSMQLQSSLAGMTMNLPDRVYDDITALVPAPPPATDRIEEG